MPYRCNILPLWKLAPAAPHFFAGFLPISAPLPLNPNSNQITPALLSVELGQPQSFSFTLFAFCIIKPVGNIGPRPHLEPCGYPFQTRISTFVTCPLRSKLKSFIPGPRPFNSPITIRFAFSSAVSFWKSCSFSWMIFPFAGFAAGSPSQAGLPNPAHMPADSALRPGQAAYFR